MKILFVVPPSTLMPVERPHVVSPLGIGYLSAVLEKDGHDIKVLDTLALGRSDYLDKWKNRKVESQELIHFGLSWKGIENHIRKENPDMVGISNSYSCQAHNAHKIAEIIKGIDKNIVTVFGGAHPTAFPNHVLKDENVDYVVIGEGELTILEFVKNLENRGNVKKLKGTALRGKKKIKINTRRELIEDIDALPFPARHLLPMREYFEADSGRGRWSPATSMITSRGCPFNCVFCSIHNIWGYKWRPRLPKNVVDEIEHLVEKYKIKELHFEDDNLTLNKKRMMKICDEMIERGLNEKIRWTTPNSVMVATLDEEVLRKIKDSGCYALSFGIESGSQYILKNVIRKNVPFDKLRNVIKICKKLGIETFGSFIIGLPGESKETFRETINLAKSLDLDQAGFLAATPFPGTELYEMCKTNGYIPENIKWSDLRTIGSAVISTENFTKEDVLEWQRKGYKEFYSSPKRAARTLLRNINSPKRIWRLVMRYRKFVGS